MSISTIQTLSGRIIPITETDVLWGLRMVMGEGERTYSGARAIVSAMARRLALVDRWPSFTALIVGTPSSPRGYSQPISFYWRNRGNNQERIRRRARIRAASATDVQQWSSDAARAVRDVLSGTVALDNSAAVHFADEPTSRDSIVANDGWQREQSAAANWLLSTTQSRAYVRRNGQPRVVPSSGRGAVFAGGLGTLAIGLTLASWWLLQ